MALSSPFPVAPILGSTAKTVSDVVKGDIVVLENGRYLQVWATSAQQLGRIQLLLSDGGIVELSASEMISIITTVA